jgi:type I restriction enzyme, S subunit
MNEIWRVKIADIGQTITGKTPSSNAPEDFGYEYMFVTPSDPFDKKMMNSTERYLSKEGVDKLSNKVLPPKSIMVTCIGSAMGKVSMNASSCITNQQINSIVPNNLYDPDYIYYAIKNNFKVLRNAATGSTALPLLNKTDFDILELPIHKDKNYQQKISSVLTAIDTKIELNNRINKKLEQMAKTLYDYWFVQFDFPFDFAQGKPNEQGKPYKSSGGKMVYNEELKREIPEGWEVGTLLDIATYTNGLACQKYRPINKNFLPVIKIREMREGFTENTEKVRDDIPDKLIVYNGDILFSWSASLEVMLWAGGKGGLNQHIFKVTSEKYPKSFYYFQLLWYLKQFKLIAELRKTTMGHITQDHLIQSRIVIPPLPLIERLDRIISPVLSKQIKLREENQELASLRDWLLPMLMNGQITVKEAEEKLDMAAEPNVEYAKK